MKVWIALGALVLGGTSLAVGEEIFTIRVGKAPQVSVRDSEQDLQRRVWELERAVFQLQQRIYHLEAGGNPHGGSAGPWVCTIRVFGKSYREAGPSEALAKNAAIKACSADQTNDFHCNSAPASCEK